MFVYKLVQVYEGYPPEVRVTRTKGGLALKWRKWQRGIDQGVCTHCWEDADLNQLGECTGCREYICSWCVPTHNKIEVRGQWG